MRDARVLLAAHRRLSAAAPGPSSKGWCVIHGDAHVGNIMVDAAGRPWLVDWQLVQRGFWQVDVGYLIAATLRPRHAEPPNAICCGTTSTALRRTGISPPSL